METPTLIYEGECPYCTGIAGLAGRTTGMKVISYRSGEAQQFLEEEFQEPGLILYFAEEGKIFYGSRAADQVAREMKMPGPVVYLVTATYPHLVKLFSILFSRHATVKSV